MNVPHIFVYCMPMRVLTLPFLFLASGLMAQPGWRELQFSFILEHEGAEVPREELSRGGAFTFEVEGRRVRPGTYGAGRFSFVEFPGEVSDITNHVDTLWLRITHRQEGVMEIGFPPRLRNRHAYLTDHLVVPFAPGRIMVTDLVHELHVTGTMTGIGQLWNAGPVFLPSATCGVDTVRHVPAIVGGAMDFRVRCRTQPGPRGEPMGKVRFFTESPYQPKLVMNIQAPAGGGSWSLDTVRFAPADYRIVGWRQRELDTTTPRDTVFGWERSGPAVHITPSHPTANDTVYFRFWWLGSGENVRITHSVVPDFEGGHTLEFVVECTPVILLDAGIQAREIRVVVPSLPRGTLPIMVYYEEGPDYPAPRFPALHGHMLVVR